MKELDGSFCESVTSITPSTNGYLVAGDTVGGVYAMEVDKQGRQLWYRKFPNNINLGHAVAIEAEDRYVFSYHSTRNPKVDPPGMLKGTSLILDKQHKRVINKFDVPYKTLIPQGKGFIASGNYNMIFLIDEDGEPIWRRTIEMGEMRYGTAFPVGSKKGVKYSISRGEIKKIIQTSDGLFAGVGMMRLNGRGNYAPWLFKFDIHGKILWCKGYEQIQAIPDSLSETEDRGFIVNSRRTFKVDASGELEWVRDLGYDFGYGVAPVHGKGYVLTNVERSKKNGWTLWLVHIDKEGNIVRRQSYYTGMTTFVGDCLHTEDALIFGGYLKNRESPLNEHGWLMRIPRNGSSMPQEKETMYPLAASEQAAARQVPMHQPVQPRLFPMKVDGGVRKILLAKRDTIAFVGATGQRGGLYVFDLKNSHDPQLKAHYIPNASKEFGIFDLQLSADENTLYVMDIREGLYALDVSDPANPKLLCQYPLKEGLYLSIDREHNIAYVTGNHGVLVFDVSVRNQLKLLGRLAYQKEQEQYVLETYDPDRKYPYYERTFGVYAVGENLLYVLSRGQMEVIDMSDVKEPTLITRLILIDGASKMTFAPNHTRAYLSGGGRGAQIIDISTLSRPRLLGEYIPQFKGTSEYASLSADGAKLYLNHSAQKLIVLDVSYPSDPKLKRVIDLVDGSQPFSSTLSSDGRYLYIANGVKGVQAIKLDP